ncbi:cupin domain-containing protein [Streptomyces afghaniensis]|uniref:cupin domain-containing protein n=1 Tax=Streptomyces afghaniensis TaxID=66865 RepID=UPI002787FB01|nr:cupin domain-containing protein [Streptomyces afghaniensis]MDQ1014492.1 quercetin dioxygenase-like cupin family protein [Streptomyces afghaniensis]
MIPPSATTSIAHWQERTQPLPLVICQIAPPHAHHNDPDTRRSHDRPDSSYGIVLQGEIVLELGDGHRTRLSAGDIVIQNGTRHAWRNHGDRPATMAFVLVGVPHDGEGA